MPVQAGDVVVLFDATVRPPKHKRTVCVCAGAGWFLRINTRPVWRPHLLLRAADSPGCLDHDSYAELRGVLDLDMDALADGLTRGDARILGGIGRATAAALITAVGAATTLTKAEKATIDAGLAILVR